ncbi:hypothetical protein [Thermobifida cellulosilytica]|uniref:Uncharacterized protein n=1 Tax=Thermobifida cellulosilytica TB100 TaxID=665004 RepID=A0A147KEA0_THECS|nr:hypothetical protein [Thermobifida cellulosilytica]KUP95569.1 hypothetical protein AC529_16965 [Thermobifida cellulosilytica TB100]
MDQQHRIPVPRGADRRPRGVDDATVAGVGKLTEALETIERARGHLYSMHQLTGHADAMLDEAVRLLREAGHRTVAEEVRRRLIGRNVVDGRWTYQLVEEYDDGYYAEFRRIERQAREDLLGGVRHVHESAMKEERRSPGEPGHEAEPSRR